MTVRELSNILKGFPQDMTVVVCIPEFSIYEEVREPREVCLSRSEAWSEDNDHDVWKEDETSENKCLLLE